MIIDNADSLGTIAARGAGSEKATSLARLVPQSSNGSVLITSRNKDVARELTGRERDIITVGAMNQEEAAQLLRNKSIKSTDDSVDDLLAALEYFPLAITQAAAYINRQPGMSASAYQKKLTRSASKTGLLQKAASEAASGIVRRDQEASNSILATWQITFDQIRAEQPHAAELLSFISFFNRVGIPKFMVRRYRNGKQGAAHETDKATPSSEGYNIEFEEDIALLHSFSLIAMTEHGGYLEMHGLVQFATRVWLRSNGTEDEWWGRFVAAMAAAFPDGEYENWHTCRTLLPHIQFITKRQPSQERQSEDWTQVLSNAGWYAFEQGLYTQAQELTQQSLDECEKRWSVENSKTLLNIELLGSIPL